jgi:hypothetical protein
MLAAVIIAVKLAQCGPDARGVASPLAAMPCINIVAVTVLLPLRPYGSLSIHASCIAIDAALKPEEDLSLFPPTGSIRRVFYNEGRVEFLPGRPVFHGQRCPEDLDAQTARILWGAETGAARQENQARFSSPCRADAVTYSRTLAFKPSLWVSMANSRRCGCASIRQRFNLAKKGNLLKRISLLRCARLFKHDIRLEPTAAGTLTKRSMSQFCKLIDP